MGSAYRSLIENTTRKFSAPLVVVEAFIFRIGSNARTERGLPVMINWSSRFKPQFFLSERRYNEAQRMHLRHLLQICVCGVF
jgi:hypothetical protein